MGEQMTTTGIALVTGATAGLGRAVAGALAEHGMHVLVHGRDAWGVIQHEFAHQVDYFLLDDRTRRHLTGLLGAKVWSPGGRIYPHREYGAERFASTLAWAYWPSAHNSVYRRAHAEATAMPVLKFRRLMETLVGSRAGRGATKNLA